MQEVNPFTIAKDTTQAFFDQVLMIKYILLYYRSICPFLAYKKFTLLRYSAETTLTQILSWLVRIFQPSFTNKAAFTS